MDWNGRGENVPASILTPKQRRFLRGEEGTTDSAGRAMRARIRERIYHGLLDFSLAFENLSDADRRKVRDEVMNEAPESSAFGGPATAPAEVAATLAFVCDMHEDIPHFERTIEHAVERVYWRRGGTVQSVEASIEVETGVDTDAAIEKFDAGDMDALTDGEREWLVRAMKATDEGGEAATRLRRIPLGNRWLTGDAVARRRTDDETDDSEE